MNFRRVGVNRGNTGMMFVFSKVVQNATDFKKLRGFHLFQIINPRSPEASPPKPETICLLHQVQDQIVITHGFLANCTDVDDQEAFYGVTSRSFPSLDRPRSPSLLFDSDVFSSVPCLPTFPPYPAKADDQSNESSRSSRGLLGRKGTAVLNKVLPRSLRLKRWSSTPSLPKLQIS